MQTYQQPIKCCLCGSRTIQRHNAQPIMTGQCCSSCNDTRVVPAKIAMMKKTQEIRALIRQHGRTQARIVFAAELQAILEYFPLSADDNKATI